MQMVCIKINVISQLYHFFQITEVVDSVIQKNKLGLGGCVSRVWVGVSAGSGWVCQHIPCDCHGRNKSPASSFIDHCYLLKI